MWTDTNISSNMGLQAASTATKRKLELELEQKNKDSHLNCSPAKTTRWSTATTSSIATATAIITTTGTNLITSTGAHTTASIVNPAITTTAEVTTGTRITNIGEEKSEEEEVISIEVAKSSETPVPVTLTSALSSLSSSSSISNAANSTNLVCTSITAIATNATSTTTPVVTTSTTTPSISEVSAEDSIAKLEVVATVPCEPWSTSEPVTDCISKLQAVAVPTDAWGSVSTRSTLATTLLSAEELDEEDDDFDDDYEEEESIIPTYCPLRYPACPPSPPTASPVTGLMHRNNNGYTNINAHGGYNIKPPNYYSEPFPQQNCSRTANHQLIRMNNFNSWNTSTTPTNPNGSYYVPAESSYHPTQQTIRCAENGKSYLELGSSTSSFNTTNMDAMHPKRCCDGRGTWCNSKSCYKDIRLKIRNLSMFKLSRFRQVSEQSLYRSVLICNTLKKIDKEIELEAKDMPNNNINSTNTNLNLINTTNNSNNNNNSGAATIGMMTDYPPSSGCARIPSTTQMDLNSTNHSTNYQQHQHQQQHHQNTFHSMVNTNLDGNCSTSSAFHQLSPINSNSKTNLSLPFNTSSQQCSTAITPITSDLMHSYDHYPFRDSQSGRATPFPSTLSSTADSDSGYGDEDSNRSINWGSVLSLSSQSALDPLNNSELFSTLPNVNSSPLTSNNSTFNPPSSSSSLPSSVPSITSLGTITTISNINTNNHSAINQGSILSSSSSSSISSPSSSFSSTNAHSSMSSNSLFSTTATVSQLCSSSSSSSSSSSAVISSFSSSLSFSTSSSSSLSLTTLTPSSLSFQQTSSNTSSNNGSTSWEYGFLDMDLGLGSEFTELVPSCKMSSAEELFKSVSPSLNTSRYVHDNELESPAHIMVGS